MVALCPPAWRWPDWQPWKRRYWAIEVIKAAEPPHLFIRTHHNKPTVAFLAKDSQCASTKIQPYPCRIHYFDSLSSIKVGNWAENKYKAEALLRRATHAKCLLCATNLSKNNHSVLVLLMWNALVMSGIALFDWLAFLTDLNRVSTLTWFRPTTITARPHHLVLIRLIFPLAPVPGRLFPCYFRRTIKHCGINNGLTSSEDFFTSCLQKAWGKKNSKNSMGSSAALASCGKHNVNQDVCTNY